MPLSGIPCDAVELSFWLWEYLRGMEEDTHILHDDIKGRDSVRCHEQQGFCVDLVQFSDFS